MSHCGNKNKNRKKKQQQQIRLRNLLVDFHTKIEYSWKRSTIQLKTTKEKTFCFVLLKNKKKTLIK